MTIREDIDRANAQADAEIARAEAAGGIGAMLAQQRAATPSAPNHDTVRREWEYFSGMVAGANVAKPGCLNGDVDVIRLAGIRDALAWVLGERTETLR